MLVCGETVILDTFTNQISVINVFEDLIPAGLPIFIPRFTILHYLDREIEDSEIIKLHIVLSLNSEKLFELDHEANFLTKTLSRSIITLGGIPIKEPGKLTATVSAEGIDSIQYSLEILSPNQPKILNQEVK
jgi:hypothetical protein